MRIHQDVLTFKFFVATWNVAGKSPQDSLNLDDFLQVHDQSDVYILGFQEIVPLNAGNVLVTEGSGTAAKWLFWISQSLNQFTHAHSFSSSSSSSSLFPCQKNSLKAACKIYRGKHVRGLKSCNCNFTSPLERKSSKDNCFNCQQSSISEDDFSSEEDIIDVPITFVDSKFTSPSRSSSKQRKYSLVVCKQMVGVFLTVWVRTELLRHISHLRTSSVSRGIMGCLGNKGCISVSMSFYQTSFCFICSHLTSGEKDGDELRRNLDVIEILKNTQFPNISRTSNCRAPLRIEEHDRAIWLGDLNYRIALSHSETRQLVEKNDWDALLNKDQLKLERGAGRVFKGWKEGRIYFAPTYKYSYNSDIYTAAETTKSKNNKRRGPAWCDRILWHGNGIRQLSYVRREIRFSDHRPVCSTFLLDVRPFSRHTS